MKLIRIEGSSTAYGYFDAHRGGWVQRLQTGLMERNARRMLDPTIIENRALPGQLLPNIVADLQEDLYRRRYPISAVVLAVGLNEAKILCGNTKPTLSLAGFGHKLMQCAELCADRGVQAYMVGPQPIDEMRTRPVARTGNVIEDDLVDEYAATMADVAQSAKIPYIDVRKTCAPYGLHNILHEDGYHPNALGHAVIAEEVRQTLAL